MQAGLAEPQCGQIAVKRTLVPYTQHCRHLDVIIKPNAAPRASTSRRPLVLALRSPEAP